MATVNINYLVNDFLRAYDEELFTALGLDNLAGHILSILDKLSNELPPNKFDGTDDAKLLCDAVISRIPSGPSKTGIYDVKFAEIDGKIVPIKDDVPYDDRVKPITDPVIQFHYACIMNLVSDPSDPYRVFIEECTSSLRSDMYNKVREDIGCTVIKKLAEFVLWRKGARCSIEVLSMNQNMINRMLLENPFLTPGQAIRKNISNFI